MAAGQIVRGLRTAAGLSQQTLATRAGVSLRTLVSIEGGKDCNVATLRKIAEGLDAPLVVLIGEPAVRALHGACPTCPTPTWHDGPCPEAVPA